MSKQFWGIIVVIVLIMVGGFALTNHNKSATNYGQATDHVEGAGTTGVTLVEYGDYQCPYCTEYYPVVKQVVAQYGDQIKYQFRNFPLVNAHQNAFAAARAGEAAALQGKFWQMHDMLYQNSDPQGASGWVASKTPTTYFNQYAQQIGLDVTKFKQDYASEAVNNSINADMTAGNKLNIQGTPSFFVNGKAVSVSMNASDFTKVIDAAIKAKASGATDTTTTSGQTQTTKKN